MSKKPSNRDREVSFLRAYLLELGVFLGFCLISMVGISYYFKYHPLSLFGVNKAGVFSDSVKTNKLPPNKLEEEPEFAFYTILTTPP